MDITVSLGANKNKIKNPTWFTRCMWVVWRFKQEISALEALVQILTVQGKNCFCLNNNINRFISYHEFKKIVSILAAR